MNKFDIESFAKQQGFIGATHLLDWNGYGCYEPILPGDDPVYLGLPKFILVNEKDGIRLSTPSEALKILDFLE